MPDLTVAQNIWFRHEPLSPLHTIRKSKLRQKTAELFERFRVPAPSPDLEVRRLTLAERQVVEIAKALARAPSVLILDEATSALAPRETEWLLALSRTLSRSGMLVIFISHRLAEVRQVADSVTVFRNGKTVASHPIGAVSDDEIITEMLGRQLDRLYPERKPTATATVALRTRGPFGRRATCGSRSRPARRRGARGRRPAGAWTAGAVPVAFRRRAVRAARSSLDGKPRDDPQPAPGARAAARHWRMVPEDRRAAGPAPLQEHPREPDAVRHFALLATSASSTRLASGAWSMR